jgi:hypothetical protein
MMFSIASILKLPVPLLLTGSVLAILVFGFVVWFLVPAAMYWRQLRAIQRELRALAADSPVSKLTKIFTDDERLLHLWTQYKETLHDQMEERDGQSTIVAVRSTIPAETYFNSQYVVDSRLRTEFFRHLPGIFTGVGIIGTFSGLIAGLRQFQTGLEPVPGALQAPASASATTAAVASLLHEVSTAFLVSAAAITAAMSVTLIEKLLIASLYRRTEEIAHDIDARYNAGAGEEYLSRLVNASEDSASQSKILKDALVNDLRDVLREVANTQIKASKEDNQALAAAISGSITESLSEPLKEIAGTVKTASGDQSATASRLLQDVLSSFSQRLNDLFGGQISGINEMNRETAQGMRDVVQTLNVLVANIESANEKSGAMMAKRMADAIEKMEQRQESMNNQTVSFVEQLRQLVSTSQSETNKKMQEALAALGQQVGGMVQSLKTANEETLEVNRRREESMTERTTSAVTNITGSIDSAVKEMTASSTRMQDAVERVAQVTTSALDKMNYGADTLNTASSNFAQAGDRVSGAMGHAATVAGKLTELTGAMTASSSALQDVVNDYRAQRDAVATLVTELRSVVESAKSEASLTTDVLARIQSATEKLARAQVQADQYLEGVSKVLGEAHQSFADATTKTLDRANTEFHKKLSAAVGLLSSSIQELDTTLGSR